MAGQASAQVLKSCTIFREADHASYAWSNLRQYRNPDLLQRRLHQLHNPPADQRQNVKKQANQIRYCLVQAEEYRIAADAVDLPTKPNLLYYSTMSLALAEVLLKHDGNYSLDRARDKHRHHGLVLTVDNLPKPSDELSVSAAKLRAIPLIVSGNRIGTFALYHDVSREMPVVGTVTRRHQSGTTEATEVIWIGADKLLPPLPAAGITLLDCFLQLPCMQSYLNRMGLPSNVLRAEVSRSHDTTNTVTTDLILHPGSGDLIQSFLENFKIQAGAVNQIELFELPSGALMKYVQRPFEVRYQLTSPPGSMLSREDLRLWTEDVPLNEFGYLYVALYIAGNYARYYPDRWLLDIESSSPLALAIGHLMEIADRRAALLTLSELDRRYHLPYESM